MVVYYLRKCGKYLIKLRKLRQLRKLRNLIIVIYDDKLCMNLWENSEDIEETEDTETLGSM